MTEVVPSPRAAVVLASLVPAAISFVCILTYSVDVPRLDDWDTPGVLFEQEIQGHLGLEHLVAQHNESRPAFPRIAFYVTAHTVGWHPPVFMVFSWICALLTGLALVPGLLTAERLDVWTLATAFTISGFIHTVGQFANQLWASQLLVYIPALCLAAALRLGSSGRPIGVVFSGCVILALIATYSWANGMTCWLLGAPWLMLFLNGRSGDPGTPQRRRFWLWTALYLLAAALIIGTYFWDYDAPSHHPERSAAWRQPMEAMRFLIGWVGFPFVGRRMPYAVGTTLLVAMVVLGALLARVMRRQPDHAFARRAAPWVLMLTYGLGTGALITIGRLGLGPQGAFQPRYATFVVWLPAASLALAYLLWRHYQTWRWTVGYRLALGAAVLLLAATWFIGLRAMPSHAAGARQQLLSLRVSQAIPQDPLFQELHSSPGLIRERARVLREHGLLDYRVLGFWIIDGLTADHPFAGRFRVTPHDDRSVIVHGVAEFPETSGGEAVILVGGRTKVVSPRSPRLRR